MSPRKTSLLDAFRISSTGSGPEGVGSPAPLPAPAPPARSRPRVSLAERLSASRPAAGLGEGGDRRPVFVLAAVLAVTLLGGAFWLGRVSVRNPALLASPGPADSGPGSGSTGAASAEWDLDAVAQRTDAPASGPESSARSVEPRAPARSSPPPDDRDELDEHGRTVDDRAFYDPANRFTVRAIRYANTPNGWQHALAVYRYLRQQGLPAISPIDQGDVIAICVGAEPRREGRLAELRQQLEALPGPPPRSERGAFAGAYYDNIDHLIERE